MAFAFNMLPVVSPSRPLLPLPCASHQEIRAEIKPRGFKNNYNQTHTITYIQLAIIVGSYACNQKVNLRTSYYYPA